MNDFNYFYIGTQNPNRCCSSLQHNNVALIFGFYCKIVVFHFCLLSSLPACWGLCCFGEFMSGGSSLNETDFSNDTDLSKKEKKTGTMLVENLKKYEKQQSKLKRHQKRRRNNGDDRQDNNNNSRSNNPI